MSFIGFLLGLMDLGSSLEAINLRKKVAIGIMVPGSSFLSGETDKDHWGIVNLKVAPLPTSERNMIEPPFLVTNFLTIERPIPELSG